MINDNGHLSLSNAPLMPVAICLMGGIVAGRYFPVGGHYTLAVILMLATVAILLGKLPRIQTILLLAAVTLTGYYLMQHPLPDFPIVQRAGVRMLEYRQQLLQHYEEQGLTGDGYAIVAAMTLGDKSALTHDLRNTFNTTGASHILALSGLHLGIIYMLVTLLVRGRRWRLLSQVATIVCLWAFAFLTGLSPSVVRAATMLTIYGLLSLGYRDKMSVNVLAFTAIVMLVIHPDALFNVGFQMSFMAVFTILLFYPLLNSMVSPRWLMEHRIMAWLWGMTILSLTAQLGVAPLIAFYFHRFSTWFLLSNFVVVPCAWLILMGGMMLLLTHIPFIAIALAAIVDFMTTMLTGIASLPLSSIDGLYPSVLQTLLVYVIIGCLYVILRSLLSSRQPRY